MVTIPVTVTEASSIYICIVTAIFSIILTFTILVRATVVLVVSSHAGSDYAIALRHWQIEPSSRGWAP